MIENQAACGRCGAPPASDGRPCDRVDCTVERLIRFWPAGYPNRTAALEHLVATVGNGYEWRDGALVDVFWNTDSSRRSREDLEATMQPTTVLPPYSWMSEEEKAEAQAAYDAARERLRDIHDRAAELATTPGPVRTDPWDLIAMCPPTNRKYAADNFRLIELPEDVRDDWKTAAAELAAVVDPMREMLLTRLDETEWQAADALAELRAAADRLTDTGNPIAAVSFALSAELGHLLRRLAHLGHDVHETPTRPADSGVWECTACGHLDVMPEKCPGWSALRSARHINRL